MKRVLLFTVMAIFFVPFCIFSGDIQLGNTKVGGHVKFIVYDSAEGTSTFYTTPGNVTKNAEGRYYTGMGFKEFILYISQEISDVLEFEIEPVISANTSATPAMYKQIGSGITRNNRMALELGIDKAVFKYMAPWETEVKLGLFKPVFTMEYGHELFWEEQMNGGKFAVLTGVSLGQMHDTALEIYKAFYIGEVSLPVYLYVLNGGYYADSNNQPGAMIHIEPEWGVLKLSGSFFASSVDNNFQGAEWFNFRGTKNMTRWSAGGAINWQGITLRSEFAKFRNERATANKDNLGEGFYVKLLVRPMKELRLMYHFDCARGNGVDYITHLPGFQYFISDATIAEFQCDIADWRSTNGRQKMIFTRPTLGIRITF